MMPKPLLVESAPASELCGTRLVVAVRMSVVSRFFSHLLGSIKIRSLSCACCQNHYSTLEHRAMTLRVTKIP